MELRCTGDTSPTVIQLWTRLLRIIYLSGCCPLDLQSKLLRMLLLKKVSYMPVVRWQGLKAATGKWQHRCRKDDCDTSEKPQWQRHQSIKLCLSCQVAETCNGHSPLQDIVQLLLLPVNAQSTTLAKTRDLGKPFLLSRKAGKGIKKSTLFPLHYWSGHETERRSNFGGVCFCHSDSLKGSKGCMHANDITRFHSKGRVVILWALLSTVWNQGLDLVTACFNMLNLSTVFILDRTIIENERMKNPTSRGQPRTLPQNVCLPFWFWLASTWIHARYLYSMPGQDNIIYIYTVFI